MSEKAPPFRTAPSITRGSAAGIEAEPQYIFRIYRKGIALPLIMAAKLRELGIDKPVKSPNTHHDV